ncbi:DMT family transporter [Streptomyces sp. NPDC090025]|uniref:DMT family transporter n=1 Tax=Streptomyces sp. NPDC090025 TaxID=3365922 RepID=UPI0038332E32
MTPSTQQPATSRSALIRLIIAMAGWGTIGVFVLESGQSAFNVVFVRCLLGAAALGTLGLARGLFRNTGLDRRNLLLILGGGACLVGNWVFLFSAFQLTSITLATVVYHTQPFFVVIMGAVLFKEKLTGSTLGWILIAFAGLLCITELWRAASEEGLGRNYLLGIGCAASAAVLYGIATITAKQVRGVKPELTALLQFLLGLPLLVPFVDFGGLADAGTSGWAWLVPVGLFHTALLYILLYGAVPRATHAVIAVVSFLNPAVAIVVDFFVYGHRVSPVQGLGILMIVAASLAVTFGWKLRRGPAARAVPDPVRAVPEPAPAVPEPVPAVEAPAPASPAPAFSERPETVPAPQRSHA